LNFAKASQTSDGTDVKVTSTAFR